MLPKPFFVLAPMDDVTDVVFREIIADCAKPDLFVTEFVNVDGLQSPGRSKLLPKLQKGNIDQPIFAQIWGKIPDNYYKTAKELVKMGFDGIDINMGCPDKAVVKNGCCSALINNRPLASEIIKATKKGAGKLPVSVKLRIGFNEIDLSWPEFILQQGVHALTVHGRTTKQMSKVPNNWAAIAEIRALRDKIAPKALIIGNGDVKSRAEGEKLAKKYKLDGIMIGRGVFADPYVFSTQSPWQNFSSNEKINLYIKHLTLFEKTWAGIRSPEVVKKFAKIYINEFDGASRLRADLMNLETISEMLKVLKNYKN